MSITGFHTDPSSPYTINQTFQCIWSWIGTPNTSDFSIDINNVGPRLNIATGKHPANSVICQLPKVESVQLYMLLRQPLTIAFSNGGNSTEVASINFVESQTEFGSAGGAGGAGVQSGSANLLPQSSSGSMSPSSSASLGSAVGTQPNSSSSIPPAVIAGSVIGAVALVTLVALLFWWRFRRSRQADSAAKKELMAEGSFTARGPNYQFVYGDATNEASSRTENIGLGEKYSDNNSAPQSPVDQEPPRPILPVVAPTPYKPLLQGPAESTTATTNAPYKQASSQIRYVPAIAGPGEVSSPAPAHSDPYGDSKTQEDE